MEFLGSIDLLYNVFAIKSFQTWIPFLYQTLSSGKLLSIHQDYISYMVPAGIVKREMKVGILSAEVTRGHSETIHH